MIAPPTRGIARCRTTRMITRRMTRHKVDGGGVVRRMTTRSGDWRREDVNGQTASQR